MNKKINGCIPKLDSDSGVLISVVLEISFPSDTVLVTDPELDS